MSRPGGEGFDMEELRSRELVGRSRELAVLVNGLDAARSGEGHSLFLVGEPGIGKSRLLREAERAARSRGFVVLPGRGVEAGTPAPYRALSEALASGFRHTGLPADRTVLSLRSTLAHLVPEWAQRPSAKVSVVAIAEAVLHLCDVAGRDRGVLLLIEDAQWVDADTLAVLEYLVHNAGRYRILCLVTVRSDPPSEALRLGRRLADTRDVDLLLLRPLNSDEVEEMVRSCLGGAALPAELLEFVRARADGVPFFVEELLAGLVATGALSRARTGWTVDGSRLSSTVPQTLAEAVEHRFTRLHPRTQRTLLAAALLGRRFDWTLLPTVTGQDEDAALASLREASYAGLVDGSGDALRFRHALTRERILDLLLPPDRVDLGARALAAVEDAHPGVPDHWSDLAAELAQTSGDHGKAVRHLVEAAERARERGALGSAMVRLERADALTADDPDGALRVEETLAETLAVAGDVERALERGRHALSARRRRGDAPEREVDLELALGRALLAAGRHAHAREYAYRAARRARAQGDSVRRVSATCLLAQIAISDGSLQEAERLAEDVLAEATATRAAVRCEACEVLGRCHRVHDVARAEQAFQSALDIADEYDLPAWRARALHELGTVDLLDNMRTDRLEAARSAATEAGIPGTVALADFHLAVALVARGDPAAGRVAAQRAAELAARLGHSVLPWAVMVVARSHAHERDREAMEAAIAESRSFAPDDASLEATAWGQVRAMLALHLADRDAACAALDRAAVLLRRCPGQHDPHRGLWALARTLADRGATAARQEAAHAPGAGTRFNHALLQVAEAVDAGRTGDPERAAARMREGMDLLRGYQRAEWLIHLTRWLVAPAALDDGWSSPVAWLQDGVRWFSEHGHEPLASSCRIMLRNVGATVPRRGRGLSAVPDTLQALGISSREVDVLRLVGRRMSNREIAEHLVLSPRTVEKHVASLIRKADVAGRVALERFATGAADSLEPEAERLK
jgi:DNA-binding CsgD family transcriptional regulator/tetratricopeptide (TPR) repeat protein/type II secretory pathway predicted ATPase ExeA